MNSRVGNESKLLPIDGDTRVSERLSYGVELIVGSENNILFLLDCQIIRSGVEGQFEEALLVDRLSRHGDLSFFVKHVGNASAGREVAVVLTKNSSDFRGGAVLVIGRRFDDHRHPAGAVAFVNDFLKTLRIDALAGAAFDRPLDVVVRHALRPGHLDHAPEPGIARRIAATDARRNADLFRKLAKDRTAFYVE